MIDKADKIKPSIFNRHNLFVQLIVGDKIVKTKTNYNVRKRTKWEEKFTMYIYDNILRVVEDNDELVFQLWSNDRELKWMGEFKLCMKDIEVTNSRILLERWNEIKKNDKTKGHLNIRMLIKRELSKKPSRLLDSNTCISCNGITARNSRLSDETLKSSKRKKFHRGCSCCNSKDTSIDMDLEPRKPSSKEFDNVSSNVINTKRDFNGDEIAYDSMLDLDETYIENEPNSNNTTLIHTIFDTPFVTNDKSVTTINERSEPINENPQSSLFDPSLSLINHPLYKYN